MLKFLPLYIKIPVIGGSVIYILATAFSQAPDYTTRLNDYIDANTVTIPKKIDRPPVDTKKSALDYREGDWNSIIVKPGYEYLLDPARSEAAVQEDEFRINSYGSMNLNMNYGKSIYTKDKYKQYDTDTAQSRVVQSGFLPKQELLLHMEGKIGKRMTVYIDHDSRREENQYYMQYKAVDDDEVIREINAGQIDINFNKSKYAVYDNTSNKGMGIDITIRKEKLQVKAFGSVTRGKSHIEYFKGNSTADSNKLAEYQYLKRTYYQLEPFKRYDGPSVSVSSPGSYADYVTLSSNPANPRTYTPYPVNIDSSGFALYMDDQNQYNNYNAETLPSALSGMGTYTKLQSGTDYSINYNTGVIKFLVTVPENARIFAVYTMAGGSTISTDPGARTDVYSGKIFVFIKFGYKTGEDLNNNLALDTGEDTNNDGCLNLDIYEIRSYYSIGNKYILSDNYRMTFYKENSTMSNTETVTLGQYNINYTEGLVNFYLREPYKALLDSTSASKIYNESQVTDVYNYSTYNINIDYYREARSFKLKYYNIIENSVQVKVNNRVINKSQYSVDYTSGYLVFNNPNDPLISSDTEIEIKYEYLPEGNQSQVFVAGTRLDYKFNDNLNFGGSLLYREASSGESIPDVGKEADQTVLVGGDVTLHMNESAMGKIADNFSEKHVTSVPIEVNAYAEVAKSYRNINTFGKALIDNLETLEEVTPVSLSEKDWILSSMPAGAGQSDRGQLFYYYYRNPSSPEGLKGESYSATAIDYNVKPGPFNIATGHVDNSIKKTTSQRSLVLDFDFSSGSYIPITTRRLSDSAIDFSGLQYMEIWYRYDGASGSDAVDLYVDLGSIDEDSDNDGSLDTEDTNNNGYIDSGSVDGGSEDRGYTFNGNNVTRIGTGPKLNSYTKGDGILNSEDLNGNGQLDRNEQVFTIAGTKTSPGPTITLNSSTGNWQRLRVYIDRENLTTDETNILQQVETVRLYLQENSGSSGRIFIDSIRFVSSSWSDCRLNDTSTGPDNMSATLVNSINDPDYRADSFLLQKKSTYQDLYGDRENDELKTESESALQVTYNIPALNDNVSITRNFTNTMDLRYYKTLHLWLNYRTAPTGEIGFILGSSSTDYIEYRFQVDNQDQWNEITMKLKSGSGGDVTRYTTVGIPDMKRIKYAKLIIYSPGVSSGTLWLNDIYVSEPETLEDTAHYYEGEIKFKRPLLYTDSGTPVVSNVQLKYINKGHGAQFSSLGKPVNDTAEDHQQIYSSMDILPNWKTQADFTISQTKTDSFNEDVSESSRGKTDKKTLYLLSDYQSKTNNIPSVTLSYKLENYQNRVDEYILLNKLGKETDSMIHSPAIKINQVMDQFLWGNLRTNLQVNMEFESEKIERSSSSLDESAISSLASPDELEKRQKTATTLNMGYTNDLFFITPAVTFSSEEIVNLKGKDDEYSTEISGTVNGTFHIPYIYDENFKFVNRQKKAELLFGLKLSKYFAPTYKIETYYNENNFQDYTDTSDLGFSRQKDARTFVSTTITIPIYFSKIKPLQFIRSCNLSYTRSINYLEEGVPYEGESTDFCDEQYGISRSLAGISNGGLNPFSYYPGYFFSGRGNFAKGRDYVYDTRNKGIVFSDGSTVSDYNNELSLIENAGLSNSFFFKTTTVETSTSINQVCERSNTEGIPSQVITWNASCNINFDLMKIFNFWFFRPNKAGRPHHSSFFSITYTYSDSMFITQNIEKVTQSPGLGLTFKWDRSNLSFNSSIDFVDRNDHTFISYNDTKRPGRDDIYIENMSEQSSFSEKDRGYSFLLHYETDVQFIYNFFSSFYKLAAQPIFSLDYTMKINRYDYTKTVSPEPYDLYMLGSTLTLDLHKNVQGGFSGKLVLEDFRNRDDEEINREVLSYELGFRFSLIF